MASILIFGPFELDRRNFELRRDGQPVKLDRTPMELLLFLAEQAGTLVTREEAVDHVWGKEVFIEAEASLYTAVRKIRRALGDDTDEPHFIQTVSGKGYRFIAQVTAVAVAPKVVPESDRPEALFARPAETRVRKSVWNQGILRLLVVFAAVAIGAMVVLAGWWRREPARETIQAIVVLPLQNLSGDVSQDYLADGITDEITTDLAKLAGPRIIARTSAMQYKGTHRTVPQIARELNVGAVVEGSFERSGDRVRVRVQLIEGSTDQHLWAEAYDRKASDILALEAEVAQDIAEHIQLRLSVKQRQDLARNDTVNPQAFQDYLQGRHYWALRTRESLNKAVEYFNRAIQEDSNYARSYAGLAHCYIVMPMLTGIPQAEAFDKAQRATRRATQLDDSLAEAHLAMAETLLWKDWSFLDAEKEFKRTLELNPNYSTGHQWYGEFLNIAGRYQEAVAELQTALALDPLSAVIHHQLATALRDGGRYDEALEEYRKTIEISPNFYATYEAMSWAFRRQGKFVEAIQSLRGAIPGFVNDSNDDPAIASAIDDLQPAYAKNGATGYFRQSLKVHSYYMRPHAYLARDYAELGDHDKAIAELSRSYREHELEALSMLTDPELDSLRSDPRFQSLVRAIGFPQQ